jgi:1,2-dihydroxy-3-keto-5-methylthiopentene dioxygenase
MTLLQVMADTDADEVRLRTDDARLIGDELATRGIVFDRRPIVSDVDASRPAERILADYADQVAAINSDDRYRHIDVAALRPDHSEPDWHATAAAARSKFLAEHRHAEDEVRFFVAGRACFYLHLEPEVFAVVCESGDLLTVPAGTRHWFDMGSDPEFAAIRFFEQADGWIGDFTGDPIGERFPTLDQLVAT